MNPYRVAIKELTNSDLTFFASYFHQPEIRSKQKAINLNADVFVNEFYPSLNDEYSPFHFPVIFIGPGNRKPYPLSRKATKSLGAKNWRLNGELVPDPEDDEGRFANLKPGDFAILSFGGEDRPRSLKLVLANQEEDADLCAAIQDKFTFGGRQTIQTVSLSQIREMIARTKDSYSGLGIHPLDHLLPEDSVEDVLFPQEPERKPEREYVPRGLTALTQEELDEKLERAQKLGRKGEELFAQWLMDQRLQEEDFEWTALEYAQAPYDFEVFKPVWEESAENLYIDVKTTRGDKDTPFHMSMAEVRFAAAHPNYRIARVWGVENDSYQVEILDGVHVLAKKLIAGIEVPEGVGIDSFSVALGSISAISDPNLMSNSNT